MVLEEWFWKNGFGRMVSDGSGEWFWEVWENGFGRARLQPCRSEQTKMRALAPEVNKAQLASASALPCISATPHLNSPNPAIPCHPRGSGVLGKATDSQRRIHALRRHRRDPRQLHRSFDPQSTWAFRMTLQSWRPFVKVGSLDHRRANFRLTPDGEETFTGKLGGVRGSSLSRSE